MIVFVLFENGEASDRHADRVRGEPDAAPAGRQHPQVFAAGELMLYRSLTFSSGALNVPRNRVSI